MRRFGIVLVVAGILALAYGGINYTRNRTVLDVAGVTVTASERKSLPVPAVVGGIVLIGGVALLMANKRKPQPL